MEIVTVPIANLIASGGYVSADTSGAKPIEMSGEKSGMPILRNSATGNLLCGRSTLRSLIESGEAEATVFELALPADEEPALAQMLQTIEGQWGPELLRSVADDGADIIRHGFANESIVRLLGSAMAGGATDGNAD